VHELSFVDKLRGISWGLVLLVLIAASCGIAVLYSAADGNMQPWAATQMIRFAVALVPMIGAAFLSIRHWFRAAYWAYAVALALMVLMPAALVLKQPDLGTAILLLMTGAALFFMAGVRLRFFALMAFAVAAAAPAGWHFLRDYQKNRIYTFLDPESDPLGAGYHILQSKIALGSGGFFGKGFLNGSQSHLSFLPEKQTDFIFTTLAEEFGFVGGVGL